MIIPLINGSGLMTAKKVRCRCGFCFNLPLRITYDWAGTGMTDLDTKTTFLGQKVGAACGPTAFTEHLTLLAGDDNGLDGRERIEVRVEAAWLAKLWTSSVNIGLFAGWHNGSGGSGPATVSVEYQGIVKTKIITPGSQEFCASTLVGTATLFFNGRITLV